MKIPFVDIRWGICLLVAIACAVARAEEPVESPLSDTDRDHWAFRPVARPPLPKVKQADWARNGIDAWILARLEAKALSPAPQASRATLLRRLSFDLTGLPPTPAELAAFEGDDSPDAYERVVERLLNSPAYGERWAQHWLDLARFAETDGFEHDKVRKDAWKYRDWVISAFNSDMPYDRFVALQLAGDLLAKDAGPTHFVLAGPDMPDQNDQLERRHNLLNEVTSTVGSVLMGLQLGCAQCHDHKYDPLSQADFYRLRAVFESSVPLLKRDQAISVLAEQAKSPPARVWVRGDHRRPGSEVAPAFPRIATTPVSLEKNNDKESPRARLAAWLFQAENPLTARVMVNRLWQHHFGRGLFDTPSDVGVINSGPSHGELLDWLAVEFRERCWSVKEMHRLIVTSATYRQASRDEGQAAIDSLPSTDWKSRLEKDPDNDLYSRFPRRRLDGETLRDSMLAAAGLISVERGGPGVMPPLPPELVKTLLAGQWTASKNEADHYRRSIYLFTRRNLRYPIFEAFDRPDANASCAVRSKSTTAPQSLQLINSEFSLTVARRLAGRIARETQDEPAQIHKLFATAYSRAASDHEVRSFRDFLAAQGKLLAAEGRGQDKLALPIGGPPDLDPAAGAALVDACMAVINSNEFLYFD